ncbi:hypothetical protein [Tateyamaria sp. syn59]|uniref:hypothetical protein n=1 Tax=Tateyamaria sp. syn59 TaxID=2576942 RepID=UPI0011BFA99A|nr:hypothetical protein [Tateyamaria sp. syn59]
MRWSIPLFLCAFLLPDFARACIYPSSLRSINATLLAVLNSGGTVSIHHRDALRRSLSQLETPILLRTLQEDVGRRDARSARSILSVAEALADGRGLRVEEGLRNDVSRLAGAADEACSGTVDAATSGDSAAGAEQGKERSTGQGGRPLTFREGVVRLSMTFTVYLVFLAFLLGLRRQIRERRAQITQEEGKTQAVQPFDQSPI